MTCILCGRSVERSEACDCADSELVTEHWITDEGVEYIVTYPSAQDPVACGAHGAAARRDDEMMSSGPTYVGVWVGADVQVTDARRPGERWDPDPADIEASDDDPLDTAAALAAKLWPMPSRSW